MAIGKNKRLTKGKKGGKKKAVDPFLRKDMYAIKAPSMFAIRNAGKTIITKTTGTKIASEGLKGRVFEISLADLNGKDEAQGYRKIRLIAEDVQGTNVVTNFHGMDMTRDKVCSLIKKWQSLIEAFVDIKTTDGYYMRMFCIGFTMKAKNQSDKSTCYAQAGHIRKIRQTMFEVMTAESEKCDLKEFVSKCISLPESIPAEITKRCNSIFPLQNVFIRKVKMLKKPKFDLVKLMELHSGEGEDQGAKLDKADAEKKVKKLAGAGGRL
jgi:small subunit ribosomal protein S3Ae